MNNKELESYINKAYNRFLDYSTYHCSMQGMQGEEVDVLNEVFIDILKKDEGYLLDLLSRKKNGYTELDFFILDMIKTYTMSDTAPYRWKYRNKIQIDDNLKDLSRLDIADQEGEEVDNKIIIFNKMKKVRDALDSLGLSERAYQIFVYKFFSGESFSEWKGSETKVYLYEVYNKVLEMVKERVNGRGLF